MYKVLKKQPRGYNNVEMKSVSWSFVTVVSNFYLFQTFK